jgi:multidrug efflux system membrane fusion protein
VKAIIAIPNRARTWAVFALLITGLFALIGCSGSTPSEAPDPSAKAKGKGGGRKGSFDGGGPAPVVVAKVSQKDVPIEVSVVGNVEAYATIMIIPQVGGQLQQVSFSEGDIVKKGQKLFMIDPRPLQAQLEQSTANLARDKALLSQAEANLARDIASEKYARAEAGRYGKLFEQGIVSKEQGDQYLTNADTLEQSVLADRAAIESDRAQMSSDQAAIENAKVQLSYTTIPSPIDGKTGNLTVKQGAVVTANTTNLDTITQIEPIYVTFAVPEAELADVKRYMAQGKLMVTARTQTGDAMEHGELTFVDNNVDMTTGTIKLKGTFPNTDRKLWPGQYVNVVLRLTTRPHALVVPNQAVQSGQDGTFVYLVKGSGSDRTVTARNVTTGPRVDQDLVIEKGLEDGDTVVTEGQLRLAPGSRVQVRGEGGAPDGGKRGGRGMDASGGGASPNADAASGGSPASAGTPMTGGAPEGKHGGRHGDGSRGTGANPGGTGNPDSTSTDHPKGKRRGAG